MTGQLRSSLPRTWSSPGVRALLHGGGRHLFAQSPDQVKACCFWVPFCVHVQHLSSLHLRRLTVFVQSFPHSLIPSLLHHFIQCSLHPTIPSLISADRLADTRTARTAAVGFADSGGGFGKERQAAITCNMLLSPCQQVAK